MYALCLLYDVTLTHKGKVIGRQISATGLYWGLVEPRLTFRTIMPQSLFVSQDTNYCILGVHLIISYLFKAAVDQGRNMFPRMMAGLFKALIQECSYSDHT